MTEDDIMESARYINMITVVSDILEDDNSGKRMDKFEHLYSLCNDDIINEIETAIDRGIELIRRFEIAVTELEALKWEE